MRESGPERSDWNFEVSFLFFFVKKCKCCCLLVPSLRVLPRISSAQMGCEAVDIYSRMNGTSLAHLLVPLYTQQSKIYIYIFLPVSFLLFFLSLSIFYFSVRGTLVVFSRKGVYGFCGEHTSTLPA